MEDEFKKREDIDHDEGGCLVDVQDEGMEGAGDFLDDAVEVSKKDGGVLDCSLEEVKEDSIPSWDISIGADEANCQNGLLDECMGDEVLERDACVNVVGGGDQEGLKGEGQAGSLFEGRVEGVLQAIKAVKEGGVLNWKKAVEGSLEGRKEMGVLDLKGKGVVREGRGIGVGGYRGSGKAGGSKLKESKIGGGPMKNCRELVFDEEGGGSLDVDDMTVNVDKEAMLECEKQLDRALVGTILGRQVPFGFLSRELKRKWGQFGRAHLCMMGKSSFVCFFSSMEARDSVLRGGPWFVGNQLVGVAKWSPDFDPSSIKGFSTPIWIRLPQLPLNLWSDQNLGRIASLIGKPLWVDEVTSSWGRIEFARICVRIDFEKKLPKGVWVQGVEKKFFQNVIYEGIDQICFHYGVVGHLNGECLKKVNGESKNDGVGERMGSHQMFGGNDVEAALGRQHENNGKKLGSSTSVFGTDYAKELRKGGMEKEVGVAIVFGAQGVESSKVVDGSSIEACREDMEGGGGWTLVTNKKGNPLLNKLKGKQRGDSFPGRRMHGDGRGGRGKERGGILEPSLRKPFVVYKRVGQSSSGDSPPLDVVSAESCRPVAVLNVDGNPVLKSVNL